MPRSQTQSAPPPVAATVHIYRGLMDRATTWRLRIDNPTNWAIVTCGTSVSFALSDETHSHAVLLLVMLFTIMFLVIEARRTRYYDLWSSWLRLLETEYLALILRDNRVTANDTWQELIVRDLGFPHFKATFWTMLQRRLRDNYMAIYLFLLVSWLLKLLQRPAGPSPCAADAYMCHAAVGPIPGWLVFLGIGLFYTLLAAITLLGYPSREASIEIMSRERTLQKVVSPLQQPVGRLQWHAEPAPAGTDALRDNVSIVED
ncbi:MAG: DUF2270 domain-containing protein [Kouleothrix sp.]|jgi:uncharacterized membrane protein|nr:DUF2270 domain-containing protein [Kouleothrix sp.]